MHRKAKKRLLNIVVHGHIGRGNVGDEAMLDVIVQLLRDRFPDSQLYLAYGTDTHPKTIQKEKAIYFPRSATALVKKLFRSDIFVIAGGTHLTCFGDAKVAKLAGILRQVFLIFVAKLFANKVLMLSIGIGPLYSKSSNFLVALALKMVNFISVRDAASLSILTKLNYQGLCTRCSDAAFFFPLPKTKIKTRKKLGISVLPYFTSHMRDPATDNDLARVFADAIRAWLNIFPSGKVCLLPICSQAGKFSDATITDQIAKFFSDDSRIHNWALQGSPYLLVQHMADMTHFIAMRYHSMLFAHRAALPTLNIAYHEKNRGLANEIAIPQKSVFSVEDVLSGALANSMPTFCREPAVFMAQKPNPQFPKNEILPNNIIELLSIK